MSTDSHFKCGLHRLNMDDQLKRNDLASCGTCKNNFILPDDSSSFVDGELYNRAPCSQDDFFKTYQYAPPKRPGKGLIAFFFLFSSSSSSSFRVFLQHCFLYKDNVVLAYEMALRSVISVWQMRHSI